MQGEMNYSQTDNFQMQCKTTRAHVSPDTLFMKPKPKVLENDYNDRETLVHEKAELINEIRYLNGLIQERKNEMRAIDEEIAHNAADDIRFQERFSDKSVYEAVKRRYAAESHFAKLSQIYENTEQKYDSLSKEYSQENLTKLKAETIIQSHELKLLQHAVEDIDQKQKSVDEELNSPELQARVEEMDALKKEYNELVAAQKKEKARQTELIDTLRKTKPIPCTPREEMEAEIHRLSHLLENMQIITVAKGRREGQDEETISIPKIPPYQPKKNPRAKKAKKQEPVPQPKEEKPAPKPEEEKPAPKPEPKPKEEKPEPKPKEEEKDDFVEEEEKAEAYDFENNLFNITQNQKFEK